ncbi:Gfo/Idh/MocA family protein [Pelagimonas varians]|uniref:Putative oxidoreductase YcjS n=1 Tax=Pelagimonas varians TaxID=696760 RepID=A0A238KWY2_9RHOB|nr:Gfo/Idh/MocA family oxidoreductase [Pelagimonas varians]PYG27987.1 putative dehydrogenase [Pelagimonas varians]SMX47130.1 putative oxidoreductase YcjS [Pelagimonas varians]
MKKFGVGIIGCGNISASYLGLAPLFEGIEVRAVADLNLETAQARAAEFSVRAGTIEELLTAEDIDIVINLTVPAAHFEVTKRILEAGKHAYSEKPYVLTLEEGEALRSLAAKEGLRVGSAPDTFLGGAHQLARAAIDEGLVGEIIGGTCHVMSRGMEAWHPNPDFFFLPGGGPVLDLGPYYITNLVQLIGPVKSVSAMASASFNTRTIGIGPRTGETVPVETPTNIHAVLEFQNGALITLGASWDVCAHRHENMELYGSGASLYLPDPNFFGGEVLLAEQDGDVARVAGRDHPFSIPNAKDGQGAERANYRCAGLADMAAGIASGRPHRCSLELATHVVEVMTAILKSAEQRRWVDMVTTCERPDALTPDQARALLVS